MASLRTHPGSPYFFLRYRDLESGKWVEESTKMRIAVPAEARRARRMADRKTAEEKRFRPVRGGDFVDWVPGFLKFHYTNPRTHDRVVAAWLNISDYLRANRLSHPRQIKREHAEEFLAWRKRPDALSRKAKHNTARLELKLLSFLIDEAIKREICDRNPLAGVRIPKETPAEKPDLTDADIAAARTAFSKRKDRAWMAIVFEILIGTGCRFNEASIPRRNLDFEKQVAILEDSKRSDDDPHRFFAVELTSELNDFLRTVFESNPGRERTVPILTGNHNLRFNAVLKSACGATSHSCRVTFISRCEACGLTEKEVMALVHHSDRLVHQVYSRKRLLNLRAARSRVNIPPPPSAPGA